MVASVSVFPQEQPLSHELNAFRLPGPLWVVRDATMFGLYRQRLIAIRCHQIQLPCESQAFTPEWNRAGDLGRGIPVLYVLRANAIAIVRCGQHVVHPIDPSVIVLALHGVHVVRPPVLDVHQEHPTRAVGILMQRIDSQGSIDILA
jgi:hypothetical protein